MLIQQFARTLPTLGFSGAFGLGSAETGAIVVSRFRGLIALHAFFETLQIDHIPHVRSNHPRERRA
jgi:hypothetical protein